MSARELKSYNKWGWVMIKRCNNLEWLVSKENKRKMSTMSSIRIKSLWLKCLLMRRLTKFVNLRSNYMMKWLKKRNKLNKKSRNSHKMSIIRIKWMPCKSDSNYSNLSKRWLRWKWWKIKKEKKVSLRELEMKRKRRD